jgi:hypothetical protein
MANDRFGISSLDDHRQQLLMAEIRTMISKHVDEKMSAMTSALDARIEEAMDEGGGRTPQDIRMSCVAMAMDKAAPNFVLTDPIKYAEALAQYVLTGKTEKTDGEDA